LRTVGWPVDGLRLSEVPRQTQPVIEPTQIIRSSPAHRPSRRDEIVDAAISVFATHGFVDAAISQVAETAGVAVTAVYYHFASKTDLYEAAIGRVLRTVDDIVAEVRADDAPADDQTLNRTIDAVWEWVDANPGAASLMSLHTPAATRRSAELRHEFDEHHVRRAFAYLSDSHSPTLAAQSAEAIMAVRVMVDLLISIHAMRVAGGPLSSYPSGELRKVVKLVSSRLLAVPR
jgi:AcrR family transcriptional regulator